MAEGRVIVLMGSASDAEHAGRATALLDRLGVPWSLHVASAHKTPARLLEVLAEHERRGGARVYLTIAGRSNALSGLADAQVAAPVIACPPLGSGPWAPYDLASSLRMPSGVAPLVVLDPENAALAAVKVLALAEAALAEAVRSYQAAQREKLERADAALGGGAVE